MDSKHKTLNSGLQTPKKWVYHHIMQGLHCLQSHTQIKTRSRLLFHFPVLVSAQGHSVAAPSVEEAQDFNPKSLIKGIGRCLGLIPWYKLGNILGTLRVIHLVRYGESCLHLNDQLFLPKLKSLIVVSPLFRLSVWLSTDSKDELCISESCSTGIRLACFSTPRKNESFLLQWSSAVPACMLNFPNHLLSYV